MFFPNAEIGAVIWEKGREAEKKNLKTRSSVLAERHDGGSHSFRWDRHCERAAWASWSPEGKESLRKGAALCRPEAQQAALRRASWVERETQATARE